MSSFENVNGVSGASAIAATSRLKVDPSWYMDSGLASFRMVSLTEGKCLMYALWFPPFSTIHRAATYCIVLEQTRCRGFLKELLCPGPVCSWHCVPVPLGTWQYFMLQFLPASLVPLSWAKSIEVVPTALVALVWINVVGHMTRWSQMRSKQHGTRCHPWVLDAPAVSAGIPCWAFLKQFATCD
eukprot:15364791-Ditylum_brightwellii.AAC.2